MGAHGVIPSRASSRNRTGMERPGGTRRSSTRRSPVRSGRKPVRRIRRPSRRIRRPVRDRRARYRLSRSSRRSQRVSSDSECGRDVKRLTGQSPICQSDLVGGADGRRPYAPGSGFVSGGRDGRDVCRRVIAVAAVLRCGHMMTVGVVVLCACVVVVVGTLGGVARPSRTRTSVVSRDCPCREQRPEHCLNRHAL